MTTTHPPRRLLRCLIAAAVSLATAGAFAACGSDDTSPNGLTTVKIGISPYFEYQPWVVAHQLGLDKQRGLNFEFTNIASTQTAAVSARRGDLDIVPSCHACEFPLFKELPEMRDFMITNQFKGFILVGRNRQTETFEQLSAGVGAEAAKQQILEQLKGRTFVIHQASYEALLTSALAQVGLTLADVRIVDMPDDAAAALAFTQGIGDYYIGSLPQEARLLQEPDKYVNVGGTDILGPAGLWYSTMLASGEWLDDNRDTALATMAVWYRTMEYLEQRPDTTIPLFANAVNQAAASNLSDDEVRYIVEQLEFFPTLEQAASQVYNPESNIYFQQSIDFYQAGNRDVLPDDFDSSKVIVAAPWFEDLRAHPELVEYITAPL